MHFGNKVTTLRINSKNNFEGSVWRARKSTFLKLRNCVFNWLVFHIVTIILSGSGSVKMYCKSQKVDFILEILLWLYSWRCILTWFLTLRLFSHSTWWSKIDLLSFPSLMARIHFWRSSTVMLLKHLYRDVGSFLCWSFWRTKGSCKICVARWKQTFTT